MAFRKTLIKIKSEIATAESAAKKRTMGGAIGSQNAFPIEGDTWFTSLEAANSYISAPGSTAYPGKIISVVTGIPDSGEVDIDNVNLTIYYIDKTGTLQAFGSGGGGGSGSVTSVGISNTDGGLSVSGSPITSSGTIQANLNLASGGGLSVSNPGGLKINNLPYTTTEPQSANTSGVKIVVLDHEPISRYSGYLYIITVAQS